MNIEAYFQLKEAWYEIQFPPYLNPFWKEESLEESALAWHQEKLFPHLSQGVEQCISFKWPSVIVVIKKLSTLRSLKIISIPT